MRMLRRFASNPRLLSLIAGAVSLIAVEVVICVRVEDGPLWLLLFFNPLLLVLAGVGLLAYLVTPGDPRPDDTRRPGRDRPPANAGHRAL